MQNIDIDPNVPLSKTVWLNIDYLLGSNKINFAVSGEMEHFYSDENTLTIEFSSQNIEDNPIFWQFIHLFERQMPGRSRRVETRGLNCRPLSEYAIGAFSRSTDIKDGFNRAVEDGTIHLIDIDSNIRYTFKFA